MDANFNVFDDGDAEMSDHITLHIKATLGALGEYREMGKMYATWPWISCLLVDEPDVNRQD